MLYWAGLVNSGQILLGWIQLFTACSQDPTWVNTDRCLDIFLWCSFCFCMMQHQQERAVSFCFISPFSWTFYNSRYISATCPFHQQLCSFLCYFLFPSFQQWPKSLRHSARYSANSVWTLSQPHLSSWSVSNAVFHFTKKNSITLKALTLSFIFLNMK